MKMILNDHNNIYYSIATDTTGNKHKRLASDNQAGKYKENIAIGFLEAFDEKKLRETASKGH